MNIGELTKSNYLKRADAGQGILVTIRDNPVQEDMAMDGEPEKMEWVLYFKEHEKGLVLKTTNAQLIAHALGSDNTEDWIGKQIVLYDDPTIMFRGQMKGGIRVRPSKRPQPTQAHSTSSLERLKPAQRQAPPTIDTAPAPQRKALAAAQAAQHPVDDGVAQDDSDVPF